MAQVRIAVVGLGSAGVLHARALLDGQVPGATLAAVVCRRERFADAVFLPSNIAHFDTLDALLRTGQTVCDAVIIATPHPLHAEQTLAALDAGQHVLCEKPAAVRASEARAMTHAAQRHGRVYALNFNRRTSPLFAELRRIVADGRIGDLRRVHWTSTDWLRVQSYYDSSPWRGTWAGEGGGMLLNQWPHVLDLWQWICGTPVRLLAHCGFGKYHRIEGEDEVNIFAEYAGGATAMLTGATGEAPGTDRVEIVGSRGRVVAENSTLTLTSQQTATDTFIATAPAGFPNPESRTEVLHFGGQDDYTAGITKDFVAAIANSDNRALLAPGSDGETSLMLANAVLLSAWQNSAWVRVPMDIRAEAYFEELLAVRIAESTPRLQTPTQTAVFALEDSFRRPSQK